MASPVSARARRVFWKTPQAKTVDLDPGHRPQEPDVPDPDMNLFVVDTMEGAFVGFGHALPESATGDAIRQRAVEILRSIEDLVGTLDRESREALVGEIGLELPTDLASA